MDEKMKHSSNTKETMENSKEAMNTVDRLESFCLQSKKIFTKARLKKAAACLIIAGIAAGGWTYYHHQQEIARHEAIMQAKTNLIASEASQKNMTLLDETAIRSIAAEAIGTDETSISWRNVALTNLAEEKMTEHKDKNEKKEKKEHAQKEKAAPDYMALTAPKDAADASAGTAGSEAPSFLPVYNVSCSVNQVKYNLRIDAVTGNVLSSRVKG